MGQKQKRQVSCPPMSSSENFWVFTLTLDHHLTFPWPSYQTLISPFIQMLSHLKIKIFAWLDPYLFNFSTKKPSIKTILGHILYAQGLPTLITVLTIILDEAGPCDFTRPNMGRFKCFVQTQHGIVDSFFQSAQFLHFHLTMGILIMVNIIFFLITGISLCSHWKNMTHVNSRFTFLQRMSASFVIVLAQLVME